MGVKCQKEYVTYASGTLVNSVFRGKENVANGGHMTSAQGQTNHLVTLTLTPTTLTLTLNLRSAAMAAPTLQGTPQQRAVWTPTLHLAQTRGTALHSSVRLLQSGQHQRHQWQMTPYRPWTQQMDSAPTQQHM